MIKVIERMTQLYIARPVQISTCPKCGETIEFDKGASPYMCFACSEELLDISRILSVHSDRLLYHLGEEEDLKVDISAFGFG